MVDFVRCTWGYVTGQTLIIARDCATYHEYLTLLCEMNASDPGDGANNG